MARTGNNSSPRPPHGRQNLSKNCARNRRRIVESFIDFFLENFISFVVKTSVSMSIFCAQNFFFFFFWRV